MFPTNIVPQINNKLKKTIKYFNRTSILFPLTLCLKSIDSVDFKNLNINGGL